MSPTSSPPAGPPPSYRVDTILVAPAELELQVGQSVSPFEAFTVEARDSAGRPVPDFAPSFVIESGDTAIRFGGAGLEAVRVGTAALLVVPFAATDEPPSRAATRVGIRVRR